MCDTRVALYVRVTRYIVYNNIIYTGCYGVTGTLRGRFYRVTCGITAVIYDVKRRRPRHDI